MKLFSFVILFMILTSVSAQTKLYVHPDADSYVKNTKTIAILPMKVQVKLRPKELKNLTPEHIVEMGKNEALDIQNAMYNWFLTREKRGTLLISVQNPARTNELLKENGIDIHDYADKLPGELGEILGAETIITGNFETSKPMSVGVAAGLKVFTGEAFATNSATMDMNFISASDDELVVNYLKNVKGSLGSNSGDLINILMRKVSRRIPYTQ